MTLGMWIATAAWICLLLAYTLRKQRRLHVCFAIAGMLADAALVLHLQVSRSALQTAMEFSLGALQQTHVIVSSLAFILYLPTLVLGLQLFFGESSEKRRYYHRSLALSAFSFRTLGFLFMFSMWKSL